MYMPVDVYLLLHRSVACLAMGDVGQQEGLVCLPQGRVWCALSRRGGSSVLPSKCYSYSLLLFFAHKGSVHLDSSTSYGEIYSYRLTRMATHRMTIKPWTKHSVTVKLSKVATIATARRVTKGS